MDASSSITENLSFIIISKTRSSLLTRNNEPSDLW